MLNEGECGNLIKNKSICLNSRNFKTAKHNSHIFQKSSTVATLQKYCLATDPIHDSSIYMDYIFPIPSEMFVEENPM